MVKQKLLSLLKSRLGLLMMLFMLSANTFAADIEITPVELNKDYQLEFSFTNYSFVATKTGILTITGSGSDVPTPYSDEAFTTQIQANLVYEGNHAFKDIAVESGKTYYFKGSSWNNGTFRLTMDDNIAITLVSAEPEAGTVYDLSKDDGMLSLNFSRAVALGSATLSSGSLNASVEGHSYNASVSYELKNVIYGWLTDGTVKAGDDITLTVKDVHLACSETVKYGTDGTLTLTWKAPALLTEMTKATAPANFLSYWPESNADGIVKLEFNGNLAAPTADDAPKAKISIGNVESETEYYEETVPVTIEGGVLSVDLTGKLRTKKTMLPNSTNPADYTNISLAVSNIKDATGSLAYVTEDGDLGSYNVSIPFEDVTKDIQVEFTPKTGSSIATTDNIELWIEDESAVSYSGVNFKYTKDGERKDAKVADAEIKTVAEDVGISLTIPVPEVVKTATNVVVTLDNVVYNDGIDHNISARYNNLQVKMIKPETNELASLVKGDSIIISTNMSDKIGLLRYRIVDQYDNIPVKSPTQFTKKADGNFGAKFFTDIKLLKGHNYAVEMTAYATESDWNYKKEPIDTTSIILKGTSEPFVFSTLDTLGITPNQETVLESVKQNTFVLTFSGPVSLEKATTFCTIGYGVIQDFESITPLDENATKFSAKWELKVPESYLKGFNGNPLTFSVLATDEQGHILRGDKEGKEEKSYYLFSYKTTIGVPDLIIAPADGETVHSLKTFTVDCEKGINWGGWIAKSTVIVTDKEGKEVAHLATAEQSIPEAEKDNRDYIPTRMTLTLDKAVTTPGAYTLNIPADAFIFGSGMETMNSKATTATYTVEEDPNFTPLSVVPEVSETATIESLSELTLTFAEDATIKADVASPVMVMMNRQTVGTGTLTADKNVVTVKFDKTFTEEGVYMVSIKAGAITNAGGKTNAALIYTYEVKAKEVTTDVTTDPADGSTVTSLKRIVLTFTKETGVGPSYNKDYTIELRDSRGVKVTGATSDIDWGIDPNQIPVTLDEEITTPGAYTLHIDANFYNLDSGGSSPELNFTYIVATGTGISGLINDNSSKYDVYTIGGTSVMSTTNKTDLDRLNSGLYIINGKKVIIKK